MQDLILYLFMAVIGYLAAMKFMDKRESPAWIGRVQTVAIIVLVFTMGSRMGANDEVIKNLGTIGLYALISVIIVLVFSIIAVSFVRRLVGLNKYGVLVTASAKKNPEEDPEKLMEALDEALDLDKEKSDKSGGIDKMTIVIVVAVFCGLCFGYSLALRIFPSYETFDSFASWVIKIGLCLLLILVGLDLGLDRSVFVNIKQVGIRILVIPLAIIAGTLLGSVICGLILPISMREMLAVGSGFGWYSLAPGIIMDAGYIQASAISFMHNVLREIIAIILIPIVSRKAGYVETVSLPGAAAMDVCLPVVERYTNGNVAIYSFVSGLVLTIVVPILVPIILG
jgi:uncharacterized membrane protein YbjE (DUF340 family)